MNGRRREHTRRDAIARERAARRRAERSALRRPPLPEWPNTDGFDEAEPARVVEEFIYWEEYFERNEDDVPLKRAGRSG